MPYWIFHFFSLHFVSFCLISFRFFRFISFRFVTFRFASLHLVSFHSVSFRLVWFRFVSFGFVRFRFVSISFRTLQIPICLCVFFLLCFCFDIYSRPWLRTKFDGCLIDMYSIPTPSNYKGIILIETLIYEDQNLTHPSNSF
jgi:hypothetical protein